MASKIGLSYRREAAMIRLRAASAALDERLGIDTGAFPTGGRDPDALAVAQLNHVAEVLETVAARTEAMVAECDAAAAERTALIAERDAAVAERDAAVAARDAARDADDEPTDANDDGGTTDGQVQGAGVSGGQRPNRRRARGNDG